MFWKLSRCCGCSTAIEPHTMLASNHIVKCMAAILVFPENIVGFYRMCPPDCMCKHATVTWMVSVRMQCSTNLGQQANSSSVD